MAGSTSSGIRSVLITGGTGTFGHACVAALLRDPAITRVRVLSRDELKQAEMRVDFRDCRLDFFLGDVRDAARVQRAFESGPDLVIHAAALKHVPACEYNPSEAIATNVTGTQHVVDAAIACRVPRVVALSSDKACEPVNTYGRTKALLESTVVRGNAYVGGRGTRLSVVRYGNVLGSRGSVLPLWRAQAASGQPIQVTDRRMTRFWMPIDDAVQLVLSAAEMSQGGEVWVPALSSARLVDLAARALPAGAVETIEEIGLRPGEKLHEVLVSADEASRTQCVHAKLLVITPAVPSWPFDSERFPFVPADFVYRSNQNPLPVDRIPSRWLK